MAARKSTTKKTANRPASRKKVKARKAGTKKAGTKKAGTKKAAKATSSRPPTTAERFVSGNYSKADLEPVLVKCPECGQKGFQATKGRFGPVWKCLNKPACKHFFDARPTGKKCGHVTRGKKCGALMVEGTKTIPDRCSVRSCPNRNPHRL